MADIAENQKGKPFYKTKKGIIIIVLFFPVFLSYWIWKRDWNPKFKFGFLTILWSPVIVLWILLALQSPDDRKYVTSSQSVPTSLPIQPEEAPTPTPTPTQVPQETAPTDDDVQRLFAEMDESGDTGTVYVETQYGHIQAIQQDDGSWNMVKIHNDWPDAFAEFGVRTMTLNFIRDVYTSDHAITQAGMTINGPGGRYYRVFLGSNQAYTISDEEWESFTANTFYRWLKSEETSRNEPTENRTFVEENL